MSIPLDKFVTIQPAVALGEDLEIDLTGSESAAGWTLIVKASYVPSGPPETFASLTATYEGGDDFVIRVAMPRADTLTLEPDPETGRGTLYAEVWRTDSGNYHPLRRLAVPFYDPVFEG